MFTVQISQRTFHIACFYSKQDAHLQQQREQEQTVAAAQREAARAAAVRQKLAVVQQQAEKLRAEVAFPPSSVPVSKSVP